jgi:hypothetical protein
METHSSSFPFWSKVMVEIERLACLTPHSAELIKCDCRGDPPFHQVQPA